MTDTAYSGGFLGVALSNVPVKKTDYVQGRCELPAPEGETTVAVKIVDMLGGEVEVAHASTFRQAMDSTGARARLSPDVVTSKPADL